MLVLAGALVMSACGARSAAVDMYPELGEYAGSRISDVHFENTEPFGSDTLLLVVQTQPSRCNFLGLPFCVPFTSIGREEHHLNPGRVVADIQALERFYRVAGYFGTNVVPRIEPDDDDVEVTFIVDRG
ncbi:MAG TPA: POTRA domain-containing protein, partial [Longimicrobiales bacterium]|nr:POTRA domain-containing protein [Longimicrobiales bacterium]